MARSSRRPSPPPAFFLRCPGAWELSPEDVQHATRVLRLEVGDLLVGLDGRGCRIPLRIRALGKQELALEIHKLQSGPLGGDQPIGVKIADGELDLPLS